jgi:hypothetical protein
MVFRYKWSDRENGNFAIRKRTAKGIEAGKKIEPKRNQTSDTHFFILVDKNDIDSMYNALHGINRILETIKYEYRQRGTDKKSGTPYLTKKDIEGVLNNIDQYRGESKTKVIETAFSKLLQQERIKLENKSFKKRKALLVGVYGEGIFDRIIYFLRTNIRKDQELKKKQDQAKKEIKNKQTEIKNKQIEINKLNDAITELEKTNNIEKANNEKIVFNILSEEKKDLSYTDKSELRNYPNLLETVLYDLAKKEIRNKKSSVIQKRYRDKKNENNGKPKRKPGRPKKTEK